MSPHRLLSGLIVLAAVATIATDPPYKMVCAALVVIFAVISLVRSA